MPALRGDCRLLPTLSLAPVGYLFAPPLVSAPGAYGGGKEETQHQDRELAFHQLTGGLEIKGARDEFLEDLAENGAVPLFPIAVTANCLYGEVCP